MNLSPSGQMFKVKIQARDAQHTGTEGKYWKIELFRIRGDRKSVNGLEKRAKMVKWQSSFLTVWKLRYEL